MSNRYLTHCWLVVKRTITNKFQCNCTKNTAIFINKLICKYLQGGGNIFSFAIEQMHVVMNITPFIIIVHAISFRQQHLNSLRPRLNRCPFADYIFKCIFLNENEWISPRISLKCVPKVRINNTPALFQIMAWRCPGNKPLYEPAMVSVLTHICVTRPQWFEHPHRKWALNPRTQYLQISETII